MQAINSSSSPLYVLPFRLTVSERSKTFCGTFFTAVSLLMTMWFLTVIFSAILTGSTLFLSSFRQCLCQRWRCPRGQLPLRLTFVHWRAPAAKGRRCRPDRCMPAQSACRERTNMISSFFIISKIIYIMIINVLILYRFRNFVNKRAFRVS